MPAAYTGPSPSTPPAERARLERDILVLQCALAFGFCLGVATGVFGERTLLAWATVAWIAGYHAAHAWYVVRRRSPGRPITFVELYTPPLDLASVTLGWVVLSDPSSPFWVAYLIAMVGYARRIHGRSFGALVGFLMANIVLGHWVVAEANDEPAWDATLMAMLGLTGVMALMASTVGSAWRRAEGRARRLAQTDPLTGIANRRTFMERLEAMAEDPMESFSILMLDLDDFKKLNDEHGHHHGDDVLAMTARVLAAGLRDGDELARYGGEEFVVALPGSRLAEAAAVAERLRMMVMDATPTTVSVGCADREPGESAENVVRRADALLLFAKRAGKNAVMAPGRFDEAA